MKDYCGVCQEKTIPHFYPFLDYIYIICDKNQVSIEDVNENILRKGKEKVFPQYLTGVAI